MDITIIIDGKEVVADARRILDFSIKDEETERIRQAARESGQLEGDMALLNTEKVVVALRYDYQANGQKGSYFGFLAGYDVSNWPIVEPTVDDLPQDLRQQVYPTRWEQVNNTELTDLEYQGVYLEIETMILIFPDNFGSSIFHNRELRQAAIDQGVFRPYPGRQLPKI